MQQQHPLQPRAQRPQQSPQSAQPQRCLPCVDDERSASTDQLQEAFGALLQGVGGEDPSREGLIKTPARAAAAFRFLTSGYAKSAAEVTNGALFKVGGDETSSSASTSADAPQQGQGMVVMRDVPIFSLCEHHMLPFWGKCSIAYLPRDTVIGLSKMARVTEVYARRLQIQERLTSQIANGLWEVLRPRGVAVLVECSHMCMCMRGVQRPAVTATRVNLGEFVSNTALQQEFERLSQGIHPRL